MIRFAFSLLTRKALSWILLICILLVSSFQIYKLIGMFKFVDEYNNWVPAALMHQGKRLYTDIFFNRMPLPAYISYLLMDMITPRADYYRIIQVHRIFMMAYASSWILFLYWQFRKRWVLIFAALFELLKPYFFGFSFQAEAMLVYPLVYLYITSISRSVFSKRSAIFGGACVWFILFTRETIAITALLIAGVLCFRMHDLKRLINFIGTFALLTAVTLFFLPKKEWFFQMVTVNQWVFRNEINVVVGQSGLWDSLLLPFHYIHLIARPDTTHFQNILAIFCIIGLILPCIAGVFFRPKLKKSVLLLLYIAALLFTSALRIHAPEREFWAIYKLIPWIGILTISISYGLDQVFSRAQYFSNVIVCALLFFYFSYPNSFLNKQIERQREYDISYFDDISYARAIENATRPDDNIFVIGYASHIYTLSHRKSSYPDSFYYPIHYGIPLYEDKVLHMFRTDPPVVVFISDCSVHATQASIKQVLSANYYRLSKQGKPSCLYVRIDLEDSIKSKLTRSGFN